MTQGNPAECDGRIQKEYRRGLMRLQLVICEIGEKGEKGEKIIFR